MTALRQLPIELPGPLLVEVVRFEDARGFFAETYRRAGLSGLGVSEEMVQDSHSRSHHGVVRGMHFQVGRGAAKLVRCARGAIYDVVVDVRPDSPTFGQWEGFQLDDRNMRMVYCPVGFAHGFCVLSDVADVIYKQSGYYADDTERGIAYDDPDVAIEWPLPVEDLVLSERDASAPLLRDIVAELRFGE